MSCYCRWSTDDFQCDLYCYESEGGFETHVAANRIHWKIALPPPADFEFFKNGNFKRGAMRTPIQRLVEVMRLMNNEENFERKDIGLAYDGRTFVDKTPEEWHATLLLLKAAGYKFPYHLITDVLLT